VILFWKIWLTAKKEKGPYLFGYVIMKNPIHLVDQQKE